MAKSNRKITAVIFTEEGGDSSCYVFAGHLDDQMAERLAFVQFHQESEQTDELPAQEDLELIEETFNISVQRTTVRI